MGRCVKTGGPVISMDFTRPRGRVFGAFYNFYTFRVLPTLGMVISKTLEWNLRLSCRFDSSNPRLPNSVSQIMEGVGLENAEVKRMTHGVTALVTGYKIT